jgi:hypothetical protein
MWYLLLLTVGFLLPREISSLNETCWPTANNLTCVLNDLLLGYNKQLRPNHAGRKNTFFRNLIRIVMLGDPIHVQVYMMIITLGPIVEFDMVEISIDLKLICVLSICFSHLQSICFFVKYGRMNV